jgi:uncharacterized protein YbjT (DUF2867 family)
MTTHSNKPEILITGATGTVGRELCKQLSKAGLRYRALTRSIEEAERLKKLNGCETVIADFNDPGSLRSALQDIKHAFLLTNSSAVAEQLQSGFVDAARYVGLEHIVKQSQYKASIDSPVRFLRYHAAVEQKIRNADIKFTFLRPNLFMQGLLGFKDSIIQKGTFFGTLGDAMVSLIDIRDIAGIAVEVLQGVDHYNKTYDLTGPEALTHDEIATHLSGAFGRPVTYMDVSDDEMLEMLLHAGFPEWQAHGLIEDYAHYGRGEAETVTNTVEQVTGRPPYRFEDFARDYADAFYPNPPDKKEI